MQGRGEDRKWYGVWSPGHPGEFPGGNLGGGARPEQLWPYRDLFSAKEIGRNDIKGRQTLSFSSGSKVPGSLGSVRPSGRCLSLAVDLD